MSENHVDTMATKADLGVYKVQPVDLVLDFMKLQEQMKKEFTEAGQAEKAKLFRFFLYGMFSMLGGMIFALWGLGFMDALFYVKFIGGSVFSILMAFAFGKFKEMIPSMTTNSDKLKAMLETIVKKL